MTVLSTRCCVLYVHGALKPHAVGIPAVIPLKQLG